MAKFLNTVEAPEKDVDACASITYEKLTPSMLAKHLGLSRRDVNCRLLELCYIEERNGKQLLTEAGRTAGGSWHAGNYGTYTLWPKDIQLDLHT